MSVIFDRPLDAAEKDLMCRLAVAVVAYQTGASEDTAAHALDTFTQTGEAAFWATTTEALLVVAGRPLVHAEREWLCFHAHARDWDPAL